MNQDNLFPHINAFPTDDRSKLHHRGLIDITGVEGINAAPFAFEVETPDEIVMHAKHVLEKAGETVEQAIVDDLKKFDEQDGDDEALTGIAQGIDIYMHLLPRGQGLSLDWICTDRDGDGLAMKWVTPELWDEHHNLIKEQMDGCIADFEKYVAEVKPINGYPWEGDQFVAFVPRRMLSSGEMGVLIQRALEMFKTEVGGLVGDDGYPDWVRLGIAMFRVTGNHLNEHPDHPQLAIRPSATMIEVVR